MPCRRGRGAWGAAADLPESHELAAVGGIAWLLQDRLAAGSSGVEDLLPELVEIAVAPYVGETEAARLPGES